MTAMTTTSRTSEPAATTLPHSRCQSASCSRAGPGLLRTLVPPHAANRENTDFMNYLEYSSPDYLRLLHCVLAITSLVGRVRVMAVECGRARDLEVLTGNVLPSIILLNDCSDVSRDQMVLAGLLQQTDTDESRAEILRRIDANGSRVDEIFKRYEKELISTPEDRRLLKKRSGPTTRIGPPETSRSSWFARTKWRSIGNGRRKPWFLRMRRISKPSRPRWTTRIRSVWK